MFGLIKKEDQIRTPHVTELNDVTVNKPKKLYRNMVRSFKAAVSSRLNSKWPSMPISADIVIERNQRILVARSREQCSNNDYAKNYVRMVHQNIVGPTGVTLQAQVKNSAGKLDAQANDALEFAWSEWSKKKTAIFNQRKHGALFSVLVWFQPPRMVNFLHGSFAVVTLGHGGFRYS